MLRRTAMGLTLTLVMSGCTASVKQQQIDAQYSLPLVKPRTVAVNIPRNAPPAPRTIHEFKPRVVSPTVIRRVLLNEHQRWVGTPYVLGGTTRSGIDCSALIQNIYVEAFSLELPRTTEEQVLEGDRVDESNLKAGDLVFFRPPGPYNHVGVYVGEGYFLHASSSQGVKLSRLDNSYWKRYYWQARRPVERTQLAQRVMLASEG